MRVDYYIENKLLSYSKNFHEYYASNVKPKTNSVANILANESRIYHYYLTASKIISGAYILGEVNAS